MTVRDGCSGVAPLTGRLEPWQVALCERPDELDDLLAIYGSPLNLLNPEPLGRNAAALMEAASGVDLAIYFARKANKALTFVDEALSLGLGVDLAGERELIQALERGVPADALVMTAAVKPVTLLELCLESGTTIVLDNADELDRLVGLAPDDDAPAVVALRLAPDLGLGRAQTRFGMSAEEALALVAGRPPAGVRVDGVHFHLDGYSAADRVTAISQGLALVDALREHGHAPSFIDIGGGFPMSYLESEDEWEGFWTAHGEALLGRTEPLTYEGHGLGLIPHGGELLGRRAVYPFHQRPVQGEWLGRVLAGQAAGTTVADAIRERGLVLRCEPGRALLDGCGLTAARVAHRKQRRDGTWLIGVEMNRTQCRSTSDDFMVDPLLVRPASAGPPTEAIEGYLVGAYCIERELLTWRRLRFPHGVAVGDIVVFPNTAGYLMHILESSSHQIPLAANVVVRAGGPAVLDAIDA